MTEFWDIQIKRADQLASQSAGTRELLVFYSQLLRAQKEIYDFVRSRKNWLPSGNLEVDLATLEQALPSFLESVASHAPATLAADARALTTGSRDALTELLLSYWHDRSDLHFFGKAFLQPYAHSLVEGGARASDNSRQGALFCPFCGGRPQVSFLQSRESNAESGNRDLLCATCLSSWEFRRVVCANCGEEQPAKLGYFHSPEFDHVRIETCESCRHYIKGVDLTRLGFAAPLVDEIYSAPLDLWARDRGFTKIELNLVGI